MIWDIFQRSLILFVHLQIVMFCIDRVNSNVIVGKKASMRGGFWGFWTIGPLSLILLPIHDKHRTTNIEQWTTIKKIEQCDQCSLNIWTWNNGCAVSHWGALSNNTLDDGHLAAGKSSVAENLKTEVEHNSPDHALLPFAYSKKIMKLTFGFTKIMTVWCVSYFTMSSAFFPERSKIIFFSDLQLTGFFMARR